MVSALIKIENNIVKLEEVALFIILMLIVGNLFLQVIFRFFINVPLDYTDELSRILFVWLIFIGSARGVYVGQHFLVSIVFDKLPFTIQKFLEVLIDFLVIIFLATLAWISFNSAIFGSIQKLPVLNIPVAIQTIAMPIGVALMAFHTLMLLPRRWVAIAGDKETLATQEAE
ncbi:TRAP transporter small permease [Litchfieldella xinjiangensis]|uniref:TRAP transporter small permease n=1 Tax=Litchfieldella xinjiangensis TaxID=1166948 RepID=UPI0006938FD4|nr:TRAP transporter small permease [Halomonas xinjiangensis]